MVNSKPAILARPELERRYLTVVFSDVVGSTALSQELDPEELSGIIDWYQKTCHEVMKRFGGHVAKYVGDGVLTYFGWPQASEDDAERSVHAALALVDAISGGHAPGGRSIEVRVAIASGLVVVRTVEDVERKGDIIGETPNLAARLQSLAEPNTVVIAPETWRLIGDMFDYADLGSHDLKGIANPVHLRQVLRSRLINSRFEGYRRQSLVPFVGRDRQISLLMECWGRVERGIGQTVLVSGEPGIGKSRLVHEFWQRIKEQTVVLRYQCSSLHTATALYPIIQQIRLAANLMQGETPDEQVAKLARFIRNTSAEGEPSLALVCNLLQLKSPHVPRLPDLAPPQLRERLVESLWLHARGQTQRGPVLAIIEDVHWIDPTTEELLLRAVHRLSQYPICLLATSREPFPETWSSGDNATCISLERLSTIDSKFLARAASSGSLADRTIERIVARAEGVPLFLEEVTHGICEEFANQESSLRPRSEDHIPSTLQALLTERLDRVGKFKHLAQVGSIFGSEFDANVLQRLCELPKHEVDQGIENLVASGLVRRRGGAGGDRLKFRHSLMRDAAYESLLKTEKRQLHRSALSYLEDTQQNPTPYMTEAFAFHAESAQLWDKAAHYLAAACGMAIAKSANREAIALFDRALPALSHLPADAAAPVAIDLRLRAYAALLAMGDIDRLVAVMREADQLARSIGDKRRQAATLSQLSSGLWLAGQHRAGLEHAELAESLASEIQDFGIGLAARFNRATLHHALGIIREATQLFSSILDTLEGELEYKRFGWTALPSVLTCGFLTWCAVELGEFALAKRTTDRALRIVNKVAEPYSIVYAHLANGLYQLGRGHPHDAVTAFDAAKAISERSQMQLPIAGAWLAAAYVHAARPHDALSLLAEADRNATYRHGGMYNWFHHHLSMAQAHLAVSDVAAAQAAISRAQEIAVAAEEVVHLAWACKIQGDIAATTLNEGGEAARRAYVQALGIAEPRGLRPLEAHCHAALAQLHERLGLPNEAAQHRQNAEQIYSSVGIVPKFAPVGS